MLKINWMGSVKDFTVLLGQPIPVQSKVPELGLLPPFRYRLGCWNQHPFGFDLT